MLKIKIRIKIMIKMFIIYILYYRSYLILCDRYTSVYTVYCLVVPLCLGFNCGRNTRSCDVG
jgi:hypothetical protein